jgi:hypothetical protein
LRAAVSETEKFLRTAILKSEKFSERRSSKMKINLTPGVKNQKITLKKIYINKFSEQKK